MSRDSHVLFFNLISAGFDAADSQSQYAIDMIQIVQCST